MIRVIVESQSNPLWRGVAMEQQYDQRGGLCEVGAGHIVVTSRQIDPLYLAYWESLGFTLPTLITAATPASNGECTLAEHLLANTAAQQEILRAIAGRAARLEFFWIERPDITLARNFPVPAYCSPRFSRTYASKAAFRRLATDVGLPLVDGAVCATLKDLQSFALPRLQRGERVIVKARRGTGGIAGGGMHLLSALEDLRRLPRPLRLLGDEFVAEEVVPGPIQEVGVHWEITEEGACVLHGLPHQIARNYGYVGAAWPADLPPGMAETIERRVREQLVPAIRARGGKGFFCCDVIVSPREHWMDFNPRKGAIRYILQLVTRLRGRLVPFWHEHRHIGRAMTFAEVRDRLGPRLETRQPRCVIVTNPGLIPYGYVDLTALAETTADAQQVFAEAFRCLPQSG